MKLRIKGRYLCVTLNNLGTIFVHKAVAEHFLKNPLKLKYVHHIDENPTNNDVSNLIWSDKRTLGKKEVFVEDENITWKVIPFADSYEVSDAGMVKNKRTNKILKAYDHGGYLRLSLMIRGKESKKFLIHTLVAKVFLENPLNLPTVDHIDRNKKNNNVTNLRWADRLTQSTNKSFGLGLLRPMNQYSTEGVFIKKWRSIKDISTYFGTFSSYFKHNKVVFGYLWKYADIEEMEGEIFKMIEDTDCAVSNMGRVRYSSNRITSGLKTPAGYKSVSIKTKRCFVHVLVLCTFLGKQEGCVVNHKDGDKANNKLDNLEWCSQSYNSIHAVKLHNRCKSVAQYKDGQCIKIYESLKEGAKTIGIRESTISAVINGRLKTAGGFEWKYVS